MKQLVSVNEAAEIFGIGQARLRQHIKEDKTIPVIKVGAYTKIKTALFTEWLNKATLEGKKL